MMSAFFKIFSGINSGLHQLIQDAKVETNGEVAQHVKVCGSHSVLISFP